MAFLDAVTGYVGLKAVLAGANLSIQQHTSLDLSTLPKLLQSQSDEVLRRLYLTDQITPEQQHDAAMVKLLALHEAAGSVGLDNLQPALQRAASELFETACSTLSPGVSLQCLGLVGTGADEDVDDVVGEIDRMISSLDTEADFDAMHERNDEAYDEGDVDTTEHLREFRRLLIAEVRALLAAKN